MRMAQDLLTLKVWLAEAELAYHQLVARQKSVTLQHGPYRSEFSTEDSDKLKQHISDLKSQVRALETGTPVRSPVYIRL